MPVFISLHSRGSAQPATTSNQFCKSYFVAANWFTALSPLRRPSLPHWKGSVYWGRAAEEWCLFLESEWQRMLPRINLKLRMFIDFNQDDLSSTDHFLLHSFNFLEPNKSWLTLDSSFSNSWCTQSMLAWTVYHFILNCFNLGFVSLT